VAVVSGTFPVSYPMLIGEADLLKRAETLPVIADWR